MTSRILRSRVIAPAVAASLAAASLIAFAAAPASAATTTYDQTTDIFAGDTSLGFTNSTPITITDNSPASVYPSVITVPHNAIIDDVNVTLSGLNHTWADDLDVLLVGPGGQQVTLISDAGGSNDLSGNYFFDDSAATALTDSGAVPSGSYSPGNFGTLNDPFPAPAPASTGASDLSVFNGLTAAGDWKLYVVDDELGVSGSMTGWSLRFSVSTNPYPSTIDVTGAGVVSDVNVKLHGVTSQFPDDEDILLVGPGGQQATLMSDAGGSADIDNVELTFDDEAGSQLPDDTQIVSGTYQPSNFETLADPYPAPAPVSTGATLLSAFDGVGANGQWGLYVKDDIGVYAMVLTGWSLEITWIDSTAPNGTVTINAGAAATSTTAVTLGLTANDPAPASGVTQMRLSNDGVTFTPYQAFAPAVAWTLAAGDGVKTVYAQFRDADGNQSAVVTDSIQLTLPDVTSPTVVNTTPKKNAKGVKVTTKVKLKVSEALNASTITTKTVYLKAKGSSKKVKAKLKYNAAGKTIVLTPKSALKHNKKYTFTATPGVKDVSGNPLDGAAGKPGAQKVTFSFTTG